MEQLPAAAPSASSSTASHTSSSQSSNSKRSLIFLDEGQPDNLDFLRNRFPDAVNLQKDLPPNETDYTSGLVHLQGEGTPKDKLLKSIYEGMNQTVFAPCMFYNPPESPATIEDAKSKALQEALFICQFEHSAIQNHIMSKGAQLGSYEGFLLSQQLDPSRTIVKDVVIGALWIRHLIQAYGQAPVLFLGRSPDLVRWAYEESLKLDDSTFNLTQHVFDLSFSGTPDASTLRSDTFFQSAKNNARNLLTTEALNFFENYMTEQGLDKVANKLYLVDILGSGTSLNSFLRILRHYYTVHLKREMPDVHFICLNKSYGCDHHNPGVWLYSQASDQLTYQPLPTHGIRPLTIRMTPIQLSHATIKWLLDNDFFQFHINRPIEFPAYKWRSEFKEALKTGGIWHEEAEAKFRPLFQLMLKVQKGLLKHWLANTQTLSKP